MPEKSVATRLVALVCSVSLVGSCAVGEPTRDDRPRFRDGPALASPGGTASSATLAPSTPVGRLDGGFSVSARGTAQYTVPLEVTPGRRGMQPGLSLHYDSAARAGLLGIGWSLRGLSAVHRCARNSAQDHHDGYFGAGTPIDPVRFDADDPLCLDGERLVAVEGDYGKAGAVYRTELDKLLTVEQVGSGSYATFIVYAGDGRTRTYGGTEDAQVIGRSAVRRWALHEVRDRWDNTITYEYAQEIESRTHPDGVTALQDSVDHRPSVIRYTGVDGLHAPRRVEFHYQDRAPEDDILGYWHGAQFKQGQRLSEVQMYGPQDTLVREYRIGYSAEDEHHARVTTIRECDAAGVCKPPTRFEYSTTSSPTPLEVAWDGQAWATNPVATLTPDPDFVMRALPMDADGDGYTDLLVKSLAGYRLFRSDRASEVGDFEPVEVDLEVEGGQKLAIGDIDGDSQDDLIIIESDRVRMRDIHPSGAVDSVGGWPGSLEEGVDLEDVRIADAATGDFDGDGSLDVAICSYTYSVPDNCTGGSGSGGCVLGDVESQYESGDDCEFGDGSDTPMECQTTHATWQIIYNGSSWADDTDVLCAAYCGPGRCSVSASYIVADFDHDGSSNILQLEPFLPGKPEEGEWSPPVAEGTSYHAIMLDRYPPTAIHAEGYEYNPTVVELVDTHLPPDLFQRYNLGVWGRGVDRIADVNGDGRADILRFEPLPPVDQSADSGDELSEWNEHFIHACNGTEHPGAPSVRVYYNTGTGYARGESYAHFDAWSDLCDAFLRSTLLDYDGDGRTDMLYPREVDGQGELWVSLAGQGPAHYTGTPLDDPDKRIVAADVWGAGQAAFSYFQGNEDGGTWAIQARTEIPDLLIHVEDGYGAEISIEYEPMSRSSVFTSGGCELDRPCEDGRRALVSRVEHETSVNTIPMAVTYEYGDARRDKKRRTSLGFGWRAETTWRQWTPVRRVETEYDVDTYDEEFEVYPFAGMPTRTVEWEPIPSAGRFRMTYEDIEYELFKPSAETYRPLVASRTAETFEAVGNCNLETMEGCTDQTGGDVITSGSLTVLERDVHGFPVHRILEDGNVSLEEERDNEQEKAPWIISHAQEIRVTGTSPGGTQTRVETREYDPETQALSRQTVRPGEGDELITEYHLDDRGLLEEVVLRAGDGQLPDALQRSTVTVWDGEGVFPERTIDPNGMETTYTWDRGLGSTTEVEDPNGVVDHIRYDGFGRRTEAWRSIGDGGQEDGAHEFMTYYRVLGGVAADPSPLGIHHQIDGGAEIEIEHDQFGREVYRQWMSMFGQYVYAQQSYAPEGWVNSVTAVTPLGELPEDTWAYTHDELGRPLSIDPPGAVGPTAYAYEMRSITVTDPRGNAWVREQDPNGRPKRIRDPQGSEVCFFYAGLGGLQQVDVNTGVECGELDAPQPHAANSESYIITSGVDAYGRKRWVDDPSIGHHAWTYNGFGEVVEHDDAASGVRAFERDALGRVIERTDDDGTTRFVYDADEKGEGPYGTLRFTQAPNGVERHYTYDGFSRPVSERLLLPDDDELTVGYGYDGFNRLRSVTYPRGPKALPAFEVEYHYDGVGNVTHVADAVTGQEYWRALETDAEGRIVHERYGNGVETDRHFEGPLLDSIETGLPGGTAEVQHLSYVYDESGNMRRRNDHRGNQYENFEYDALDRISSQSIEKNIGSVTVPFGGWSIEYGPLGNIVHRSDVGEYLYEDNALPLAVTRAGDVDYTYENYRQATRAGFGLEYNARGKIREVTGLSTAVTFVYDAIGDRVQTNVAGGLQTTTMGRLYERRVDGGSNGGVSHDYYVRAGQTIAARVRRSTGPGGTTSTTTYHHADHLGSTDVVTDAAGIAIQRHSYDAYGAPRSEDWTDPSEPDNALGWPSGFTGHDDDRHAGLTYMKGRFYDARVGRFITADPGVPAPGTTQAYDRYAYVYNRPLGMTDPTGFFAEGGEAGGADTDSDDAPADFIRVVRVPPVGEERSIAVGYDEALLNADPYWQPEEDIRFEEEPLGVGDYAAEVARGVGDLFMEETVDVAKTGATYVGLSLAYPLAIVYGGYQAAEYFDGVLDQGLGDTLAGLTPLPDAMAAYDAGAAGDISGAVYHGLRAGKQTVEWVMGTPGSPAVPKCFGAGTLIETDLGPVAIEDVAPGDMVLARNPVTGEQGYREVLRTFERKAAGVLEVEVGDDLLQVTEEHPFWVRDRGWIAARALVPGDELFTSAGGWVRVGSSTWVAAETTVYNLEVDGLHTYFVGDVGVLAHNMCPRKPATFDARVAHGNGDVAYTIKGHTVVYKNNQYPDFSPFLYQPKAGSTKSAVVVIEYTGSRRKDFKAANRKGGFTFKPAGYTWHHHDFVWTSGGKVFGFMVLVESKVHGGFPHTGGVAKYQELTGVKYKK